MFITHQTEPTVDERLSDTRIWLHVLHSAGTRKLVLSPDTDVYHMLDVIVRLSPFNSIDQRLLDLPALLRSVVCSGRKHQTLFIATGCDYISFFNGLGKTTFLNTLFEYTEFITSNSTSTPGTLTDEPNGFLSFLRLVGCAYFKKHKSAFLPSFPTPMTLFNSVQSSDHQQRHEQWLELIRDRTWMRIQYEEDMTPSHEALLRHWKRSNIE